MTVLVIVISIIAIAGWAEAAFALYCLAKFSIAQGRFDTDAAQRAWNMSRALDAAVSQRITVAKVDRVGWVSGSGAPVFDSNAQARGRVDEVHERERDANRLRDDDAFDVREMFPEQPPVEEMEG